MQIVKSSGDVRDKVRRAGDRALAEVFSERPLEGSLWAPKHFKSHTPSLAPPAHQDHRDRNRKQLKESTRTCAAGSLHVGAEKGQHRSSRCGALRGNHCLTRRRHQAPDPRPRCPHTGSRMLFLTCREAPHIPSGRPGAGAGGTWAAAAAQPGLRGAQGFCHRLAAQWGLTEETLKH